ncbi:MAG: hypothetical protein N838_17620 [Thiohalocapsa sp. PB-PSB1]|jgi:hypothetical protein|nr:MAG: hypothetical protein N838_17620 [Thiohalocapsa sp. PB-PSB1]
MPNGEGRERAMRRLERATSRRDRKTSGSWHQAQGIAPNYGEKCARTAGSTRPKELGKNWVIAG